MAEISEIKGCKKPEEPFSGIVWDLVCPKVWDELQPTDDPGVRFCTSCVQKVHLVNSLAEVKLMAKGKHCVFTDFDFMDGPRMGSIRQRQD